MTDHRTVERVPFSERFRRFSSPRQWVVDANDGVIATAGLLEGFAGAGADDRTLMIASTALIVAGSLSLGGAKWVGEAGELDAQRRIIAEERAQLATSPDRELNELTEYWVEKGLSPQLAAQVAHDLSAKDPLAAQLEFEHHIDEPTPSWQPVWAGVTSAIAYFLGSLVPLLITFVLPVRNEPLAILVAVIASLLFTSWLGARAGGTPIARTIIRTVLIGVGTVTVSYLLGNLLF